MDDTGPQDTQESGAKKWVETWVKAGDALESIRHRDVRLVNTADALRSFTGSVLNAIRTRPDSQTSGLVEQQRIFRKFRIP